MSFGSLDNEPYFLKRSIPLQMSVCILQCNIEAVSGSKSAVYQPQRCRLADQFLLKAAEMSEANGDHVDERISC